MPLALKGKALERLRAKDAREKAVEERKATRLAKHDRQGGTVERFLSFIDTSGGPDACHPWCGNTDVNHRGSNQPTFTPYEVGVFNIEGYNSPFAHRLVVMLAYNVQSLPKEIDIAPKCGDHLCCNINHLVVRENRGKDRVANQIEIDDYFAGQGFKETAHKMLEQAADALLAA